MTNPCAWCRQRGVAAGHEPLCHHCDLTRWDDGGARFVLRVIFSGGGAHGEGGAYRAQVFDRAYNHRLVPVRVKGGASVRINRQRQTACRHLNEQERSTRKGEPNAE